MIVYSGPFFDVLDKPLLRAYLHMGPESDSLF